MASATSRRPRGTRWRAPSLLGRSGGAPHPAGIAGAVRRAARRRHGSRHARGSRRDHRSGRAVQLVDEPGVVVSDNSGWRVARLPKCPASNCRRASVPGRWAGGASHSPAREGGNRRAGQRCGGYALSHAARDSNARARSSPEGTIRSDDRAASSGGKCHGVERYRRDHPALGSVPAGSPIDDLRRIQCRVLGDGVRSQAVGGRRGGSRRRAESGSRCRDLRPSRAIREGERANAGWRRRGLEERHADPRRSIRGRPDRGHPVLRPHIGGDEDGSAVGSVLPGGIPAGLLSSPTLRMRPAR